MGANQRKGHKRRVRNWRRKGFFSTDAGTAALVALVTAAIAVLSLKTTVHALAWEAGLASSESTAIRLADFLLKQCDYPGLSECDDKFAYSHILGKSKVEALGGSGSGEALKKLLGGSKNVSVRVLETGGKIIASAGNATAPVGGVCVRRVALLDLREVILEACSE